MKKKVRKYVCFVQARLTQEQMERVKTLMNIAGYRSISNYLRDLFLNTSLSDQTMTELMRYTSELRDEFAVILHFIKKYLTANGYDGKI